MAGYKSEPVLRLKQFSDVYISTGNGKIKNVIKKGFDELGGINKFIKPGQSVLIKPNLVTGAAPTTGSNTDVTFCEAVVELIKEYCDPGRIVCGENTETGTIMIESFEKYGYTEMCGRQGIELMDFALTERVDVNLPDAMYAETVNVPKVLLDTDVFITLPLLKNHDTVCITAAIKNSFGLVTDATRRASHRANAIEQYLVDIARVRKPDFAIVDGRIGQEGIAGGSHFDHPRYANRIVMGADPVAVDTVCAHIMDQNPRVRYLQWADEYGLGNCNPDYINIHGMSMEDAKIHFMTPAEHIEENSGGQFRLTDLDSCSRCRAVAQGTLHRFRTPESVLKKVDIVYGPGDWDIPDDLSENCLLVGNCIQERYRSRGVWVQGCPMARDDYFGALNSMDVVCSKCGQLVSRFTANHTPEELAFVRILASNKTITQGLFNRAGVTDFLMAVGECQQRYADFHIFRGIAELQQMGIGDKVSPDFFVVRVKGHNPTMEQLEDAFAELKERSAKWTEMQPSLKRI